MPRPGFEGPAGNLDNFLRTLATPEPIKDWSLTSLKEKLIKIGAKVVSQPTLRVCTISKSKYALLCVTGAKRMMSG